MYTLGELIGTSARNHGDRTAVVFEGERWTYAEFDRRVNRCAGALQALGCAHGDRIAILGDNSARFLETYFGAAKLGVSVTPLNVRLGDGELLYIVNDSEASILLFGDGYEARYESLRGRLAGIRAAVAFDGRVEGALEYEELLASASDRSPAAGVAPDDLAILMYTGGTTGLPKGVMLTHRNVVVAAIAAALHIGATREDATCFVLPMFHVSWWPILTMLLVGGKVCINRRPDLAAIFDLIAAERCTHMNLVPTIYGWIVEDSRVDGYDLSSLRALTYGGSPFPVEVLRKCIRKFGPRFGQGYGATETAGAPITMLTDQDHVLEGDKSRVLSSAGRPALFSRVRIVDENDEALGPGEIGEICAQGEYVMKGYWKNPDLTARALKGGWYHTGDLGYVDEDGYVYLTDRKADMIITGGENVYPKEVENVLYAHPAVRECAVIAAPDARWGEIVQAVVVLAPGRTATEQELVDHCRKELAAYKCPKAVAVWDDLPKTVIGKISKIDIKKRFREAAGREDDAAAAH